MPLSSRIAATVEAAEGDAVETAQEIASQKKRHKTKIEGSGDR
jgi:hypothetical protein